MTDLDAHFEDGLFDCPNCGEAQGFQLISHGGSQRTIFVRRFFGGKGEPAFECDGCQGVTPVATALSNGTPIAAAALRHSVTDLLAGMVISDGEVLDAELDLIFRILDALHIPHGPLQKRMEDWQQNPPEEDGILANLDRYLPYLDRKARAILLEASYHMAVVDRFFHENELQFLKKIAAKLDILPGEFEIIIDLAQEEEVFFTSLLDHFDAIEKQSREHAARAFFPEPT